jgi:hypothetical protein
MDGADSRLLGVVLIGGKKSYGCCGEMGKVDTPYGKQHTVEEEPLGGLVWVR